MWAAARSPSFFQGRELTRGIAFARPPSHEFDSPPRLATVFAGAIALFPTTSRADGGAAMKVAVVDVQRVVMQTEDGLRAQATLKKLFDSRQQELNRKQTELGKQKDEIEKQQKVLSKEVYQKRVDEWQKQMMELQQIFVEYNKELEKKQKELTDPVFEKVMGIIKRIAARDGYDLIVDKQTVAYIRSDLDLTDQCIQLYNGGGAAPAPRPPQRRRSNARARRPWADLPRADVACRARGAPWREVRRGAEIGENAGMLTRVVPVERAGEGDLAPLLASRFVKAAREAKGRGAALLVDRALAERSDVAALGGWVHAHAAWALAAVLDACRVDDAPARWGEGTTIAPGAWLGPRVVLDAT